MIKKYTSYLVFLLIFVLPVQAQKDAIKIWPNLAPGSENVTDEETWVEGKEVSNVYQPALTLFVPEKSESPVPAIIIFPGGGYRKVVMRKEGYKIAEWCNKNGMAAFVLKYRLNPNDALRDAQRAISLIRYNAEEYGIDKNKIGLIGFSAGANLAGNVVEDNQEKINIDDIDEISHLPNFWIGVYGVYGDIDVSGSGRDIKEFEAHKNIPPTFLVHAGNDPSVPAKRSVDLYLALKENDVPAELHVYQEGKHGFALETDRGDAITSTVISWSTRCLEWLKVREIL